MPDHNENFGFVSELAENLNITALLNKEAALQVINDFLKTKMSEENKTLFATFRDKVQKEGFSHYLLQRHCLAINAKPEEFRTTLFKHWRGAKHSAAAHCIQELYFLATGTRLNKTQVKELITKSTVPSMSLDEQFQYRQKIKKEIQKILHSPLRCRETDFKKKVLDAYLSKQKTEETVTRARQIDKATEQRRAEAAYQKKLLDKAIAQATERSDDELFFDPQGHIMVEVEPLSQIELAEINTDPEVIKALGAEPDRSTLCSIDSLSIPALRTKFERWFHYLPELQSLIATDPKELSSIIPLQKEMTFYLLLATRVLREKLSNDIDDKKWNDIILAVTTEINKKIQQKYIAALKSSTRGGEISVPILNSELDQARRELASESYQLLAKECVTNLKDSKDLAAREKLQNIVRTLTNKDFTTVTATGKDYLRFDAANGIAKRLRYTDQASQNKSYGVDRAFRLTHTTQYDGSSQEIQALDRDLHCVARIPAIAQAQARPVSTPSFFSRLLNRIFKIFSHRESVEDVKIKLGASYQEIKMQLGDYNGPMIYNLLTSLHSKFYDFLFSLINREPPRASAARILKGAHAFNAEQIKKGNTSSLWYVQNIPVNQHTYNLNYHSSDQATREATLMTDIALLATFNQGAASLPDKEAKKLQRAYFEVHRAYQVFLKEYDPQGTIYFSETPIGQRVMSCLTELKKSLISATDVDSSQQTTVQLATKALLKLYANNNHWNKQFGMLAQSLSVFVEKAAQVGCKDAIDRTEAVLGRELMLESLLSQPTDNPLLKTLTSFVNDKDAQPQALQQAMDEYYNQYGLYSLTLSSEDNGGPTNTRPSAGKDGGLGATEVHTRISESGHVDRLRQENAEAMRGHTSDPANGLLIAFQVLFAPPRDKDSTLVAPTSQKSPPPFEVNPTYDLKDKRFPATLL